MVYPSFPYKNHWDSTVFDLSAKHIQLGNYFNHNNLDHFDSFKFAATCSSSSDRQVEKVGLSNCVQG